MHKDRKRILAISGSTRINASNDLILQLLQRTWADRVDITIYDHITQLPYFTPGAETPPEVLHFIQALDRADGVLICTPEYVFSLPGVLKNALEWTVSTVVFADKPTAFIVASASGEKAFESLHLILATLGARMEGEAQLLIRGIKGKLNTQGEWLDPVAQRDVEHFMDSFVNMIMRPVPLTSAQPQP